MKRFLLLAMLAAFGISMLGLADNADARRFGGGFSFGKQRMHMPSRSFSQQRATSPRAGQRGRARTGMMGMLGGLAMGGLLGALFFGGSFQGINFFDIIIISGVLALLFFFLRKRADPSRQSYAGAQPSPSPHDYTPDFASSGADTIDDGPREPVGAALRPEIDKKHFLSAAKDIYVRMQKAWDHGDTEDIRKFCTSEMADRIASDMKPGTKNITEVATLNAEIADSWIESDLEWIAVSFTAMLREKTLDASGTTLEDQTAEVNEVWIFQHPPKSDDPTWHLAGIQQAG